MAPKILVGTRAQCEALQALARKLMGYPRLESGNRHGGGVFAPDAPTAEHVPIFVHPTVAGQCAVPLHDLAAQLAGRGARLTAGERTQLQAAIAAAVDRTDDWNALP